ncbi:hypothetical protein CHLNCDRAFT_135079 [Chlorella variabilis]|uniref:Apple domain-containing protein n=1 Tax=Chlorella variabilis TaxID=554065 RepID=E1ZHG6_CHLVA|nr:hypothetical protein CHLNCDRAFT_135079 [Chlorella variabilis]EFN54599.1 hypothetical protein CHLNCDRAFT_135079 [Chlorella variabilis]|eukprot:XP_005846701.1 hypothetical protein CHLNCDRAFT_135079 [Chlorella variabilis]
MTRPRSPCRALAAAGLILLTVAPLTAALACNTLFEGSNLLRTEWPASEVQDPQVCYDLCQINAQCVAWSFAPGSGTQDSSPSPTNPFNARHLYLCGGGEYSGTVLKVVFAWGYGDCCNKCKETPECTRFTSLDYTCTLKSGTDYKTEAGFGGWSGRLSNVLAVVNKYRQRHGSPALKWDNALAQAAQKETIFAPATAIKKSAAVAKLIKRTACQTESKNDLCLTCRTGAGGKARCAKCFDDEFLSWANPQPRLFPDAAGKKCVLAPGCVQGCADCRARGKSFTCAKCDKYTERDKAGQCTLPDCGAVFGVGCIKCFWHVGSTWKKGCTACAVGFVLTRTGYCKKL